MFIVLYIYFFFKHTVIFIKREKMKFTFDICFIVVACAAIK